MEMIGKLAAFSKKITPHDSSAPMTASASVTTLGGNQEPSRQPTDFGLKLNYDSLAP